MQFQHYDLGNLRQGQTVEITLQGSVANVLLLDSSNFNRYRNGLQYEYYGGNVKTSITRLPVPLSGHWHIAIDLGGYSGTIRSVVKVL